jgi:hypothetical protein
MEDLSVSTYPYTFTLEILRILSFSGLLLIIVKLLFALGKAAMHEGVKNFERRHAMRFGRLYIELRGKDWNFEELKEAFQWNRESSSAFRDIDLKHVSDTTLNLLLMRLNEVLHSAGAKTAERIGGDGGPSPGKKT